MFNDNRPIGCRAGNIDATGTIRRASFRLPAPRACYENPWNSRDRDKNNPPVDRYSRASRVTRLTSGRTPSRDEVDATPFPRFRDDAAAAAAADSAVFAAPIPTGLIPFFLSFPPLFFFERGIATHTYARRFYPIRPRSPPPVSTSPAPRPKMSRNRAFRKQRFGETTPNPNTVPPESKNPLLARTIRKLHLDGYRTLSTIR